MGVFRFSISDNTPTSSADGFPSDKKSRFRSYVTLAAAGVFITAGVAAASSPAPNSRPPKSTKHDSTITLKSSTESTILSSPAEASTAPLESQAGEQVGASTSNTSSNTVTVNEKTITLPANGTITREFTDESGQTSLEASSTSTSTTGGSSTSTLDINISTDSNNWRVTEDNP